MLAKERAKKNREKRGDPVRVVRRREPIRRRATAAPPLPPATLPRARRRSRQTEEGLGSPSDSHDGPGNAALGGSGLPPLLPTSTRRLPTTTKGDDDEGTLR
jgi:hypothetical protein